MGFAVFVLGVEAGRDDFLDRAGGRSLDGVFAFEDDEASGGQGGDRRAHLDAVMFQAEVADSGFDFLTQLVNCIGVGQSACLQEFQGEREGLVDGGESGEAAAELPFGQFGL